MLIIQGGVPIFVKRKAPTYEGLIFEAKSFNDVLFEIVLQCVRLHWSHAKRQGRISVMTAKSCRCKFFVVDTELLVSVRQECRVG